MSDPLIAYCFSLTAILNDILHYLMLPGYRPGGDCGKPHCLDLSELCPVPGSVENHGPGDLAMRCHLSQFEVLVKDVSAGKRLLANNDYQIQMCLAPPT